MDQCTPFPSFAGRQEPPVFCQGPFRWKESSVSGLPRSGKACSPLICENARKREMVASILTQEEWVCSSPSFAERYELPFPSFGTFPLIIPIWVQHTSDHGTLWNQVGYLKDEIEFWFQIHVGPRRKTSVSSFKIYASYARGSLSDWVRRTGDCCVRSERCSPVRIWWSGWSCRLFFFGFRKRFHFDVVSFLVAGSLLW